MALSTYPAVASPVKSIQRGSAGGAGSITITTISPSKATLQVFGTASSGTVSASFGLSQAASGNVQLEGTGMYHPNNFGSIQNPTGATIYGGNVNGNSGANFAWYKAAAVNAANYNVNAGSNNLVSAVVSGYISDATTIVVTGACRWEVVEYN